MQTTVPVSSEVHAILQTYYEVTGTEIRTAVDEALRDYIDVCVVTRLEHIQATHATDTARRTPEASNLVCIGDYSRGEDEMERDRR